MMKKVLLMAVCAIFMSGVAMAAGPSAQKARAVYVAPKFIYVSSQIDNIDISVDSVPVAEGEEDKTDIFGGAMAVGYDFHRSNGVPVRTELEGAIRETSEGIGVDTIFVNMFYDLHNSTRFTPYIGAGLGMSFVEADFGGGLSDEDTGLAWNAGVGVNYDFNDCYGLGLGYRYVDYGDATVKATDNGTAARAEGDLTGHEVLVTGKYSF